jgi:hypothetical protein
MAVEMWVAGVTNDVEADYEYGPFGEPIRVRDRSADANPFRISPKYTDAETGMLYYG